LQENKPQSKPVTIGFSSTPTLYKLHWRRGGEEYVHCGADILLNGLQGDLEGEATCPVCKTKTQLAIAGRNIGGLEPRDAILHVVEMPTRSGRIWIECESTHIFDRKDCFQKWISGYSGKKGLVTSVEDYHRKLVERRSSK
jgi:hypothetical protein